MLSLQILMSKAPCKVRHRGVTITRIRLLRAVITILIMITIFSAMIMVSRLTMLTIRTGSSIRAIVISIAVLPCVHSCLLTLPDAQGLFFGCCRWQPGPFSVVPVKVHKGLICIYIYMHTYTHVLISHNLSMLKFVFIFVVVHVWCSYIGL